MAGGYSIIRRLAAGRFERIRVQGFACLVGVAMQKEKEGMGWDGRSTLRSYEIGRKIQGANL